MRNAWENKSTLFSSIFSAMCYVLKSELSYTVTHVNETATTPYVSYCTWDARDIVVGGVMSDLVELNAMPVSRVANALACNAEGDRFTTHL
jgi:hypothetical protein